MQQTEKYKLNLIERDDPFSPEALNENAEKVEGALSALGRADAAQQEAAASLDDRVTTLEARHFVIGSYVGSGESSQEIILGFTPRGVLAQENSSNHLTLLALEDWPGGGANNAIVKIIPNGFRVRNSGMVTQTQKNTTYYFVAFD